MTPRRYGSRGSTIQTNDDYGKRLMGLLDSLTMFSPMKPAAESLLYAEDYPVAPFATPEDRFDNLMEDPKYQGLLTDAGMAGQGLPVTAPGIVIGAKAKNFPKALAEKFEQVEAEQLEGLGAWSRQHPWWKALANKKGWEQTGVYRGPDGKLRYEIDDSAAEYIPNRLVDNEGASVTYQTSDILNHPELFDNYNDVGIVPLSPQPLMGYAGYHMRATPTSSEKIVIDDDYFVQPNLGKKILLHEIQHGIQGREGFTRGSNLDIARRDLNQSLNSKSRNLDYNKIKEYGTVTNKLSHLRKVDYINYLRRLENSEKPQTRLLTRLSDFGINQRVSDQIGAMPKRYGKARYDWVRNGARVLRQKAENELASEIGGTSYMDEILDLLNDPKKLKSEIGKLDRKLTKLAPAARAEKEFESWRDALAPMSDRELYKRIGGEAESRMVEKRMNYTPAERAATFPLDDYDVPLDELIIQSLLD